MSAYTGIYTDLNGLAGMRAAAERRPAEALEEVAGQFEALFTRMMLKTMRESSLGDSLFDSSQNKQYLEMFDSQVSIEMSRGRGLGLKEMLIRQLGGEPASTQAAQRVEASLQRDWHPVSKRDFVEDLLPFARRVEDELGIAHEAVIAQAALESGWGQHTMQRSGGGDAFNLFGIKADKSWRGDAVSMRTLEFDDGIGRRETARFRAYDSLDAAMDDYTAFIRDNPRYRAAIEQGADAHAYARELQQAGYATDPDYANKLSEIIDGDALQRWAKPAVAQN